MSLNFDTIDSADFEYISKDIAEIITDSKLTCYPAGRDGGIDASDYYCENYEAPKIILQAKHWEKTGSISKLKSAFGKLVTQLERYAKSNPQLLLFTTLEVTRDKQKEFQEIARAAGFTKFYLIDKQRICDFLEDPSNADVLRKHFKLWLSHTNVLSEITNRSKFIDCDVFFGAISEQERLFVQTSVFDEATTCLNNGDAIVIVGDPGTGKTTLSKMLALYFAGEGYTIYYTTSNKADDAKSLLSHNLEAKELVVLDDFLGQACMEVNAPQLRSIASLIAYVRKSKHRKIILNSRITIFNEARGSDREFKKLMTSLDDATKITNMDHLTDLDRARILQSNLFYYDVPEEYIREIAKQISHIGTRGYLAIVNHRNYNPRIVETACSKEVYSRVPSGEYMKQVWSFLNNPSEIWKNEFDRRLKPSDRVMMYTLFSLSDQQSFEENMKKAFEKRAYDDTSIDTTINAYEESSSRLREAMLRSTVGGGKVKVSALNPSLNDYITSYLRQTDSESAAILRSAVFSDQIKRVAAVNQSDIVKDIVRKNICDGNFLSLPSIVSSPEAHLIEAIISLDLLDDTFSKEITTSLLKLLEGQNKNNYVIGSFIRYMLESDFYEQVPIIASFFGEYENQKKLFSCLDLDDATRSYRLAQQVSKDAGEGSYIYIAAEKACSEKISSEFTRILDDRIIQCACDLVDRYFTYDEEEKRYDQETGNLSALQAACVDSLNQESSELVGDLEFQLFDDSLFDTEGFDAIFASAVETVVENAYPYDWVFEADSDWSPLKNAQDDLQEQAMIDRLFEEYV
jgi:DNA replication protein DnaC